MFWNFRGRESFEESEGGYDDPIIESPPLQLILQNRVHFQSAVGMGKGNLEYAHCEDRTQWFPSIHQMDQKPAPYLLEGWLREWSSTDERPFPVPRLMLCHSLHQEFLQT